MDFKENFYYRGNKNKIIREMFYIYSSTYMEVKHRKRSADVLAIPY